MDFARTQPASSNAGGCVRRDHSSGGLSMRELNAQRSTFNAQRSTKSNTACNTPAPAHSLSQEVETSLYRHSGPHPLLSLRERIKVRAHCREPFQPNEQDQDQHQEE